jgi:pimeloyl-ACP methyl ester carboxylesterase
MIQFSSIHLLLLSCGIAITLGFSFNSHNNKMRLLQSKAFRAVSRQQRPHSEGGGGGAFISQLHLLKKNSPLFTTTTRLQESKRDISSSSSILSKPAGSNISIADTPLGSSPGSDLLNGLDIYEVCANDGHPISVYGLHSKKLENDQDATKEQTRRPILLLHGRTWSAVPVYHLLGGGHQTNNDDDGICATNTKSRSLMESIYDKGLQPYTMDFRGFGGTPMDETCSVIPNRCVQDVEAVLDFITLRHQKLCSVEDMDDFVADNDGDTGEVEMTHENVNSNVPRHLPALLGWSQGALVAQLAAQQLPKNISKLVLYGSIYDPLINYQREPLYNNGTFSMSNMDDGNDRKRNTFNEAIEDFTIEGSIPPEPAKRFAEAALMADPLKAEWRYLCQFNNLDPARIHVPTLVIAGDQDPYAPLRVQADLFTNLGRGVDRTWSIIADADHAVHLLNGRDRFLNIVTSFVENGKQGESKNLSDC